MAVIAFSKPVSLPIAPLRDMLKTHLPLFSWQIGEQDDGSPKQMGTLYPHQMIVGRFEGQIILTELNFSDGAVDGPAPPHICHVTIGAPTTDTAALADRVTLVLCAVMMILDEHLARCQLHLGGPWLSPDDVVRALKLVGYGEPISVADGLGIPAAHFAGAPAVRAVEAQAADPRLAAIAAVPLVAPPLPPQAIGAVPPALDARTLPPLVLLLGDDFAPDWDHVRELVDVIDPDGGWTMRVDGAETVFEGRGTRVMTIVRDAPVPQRQIDDALTRSHWLRDNATAHSRHLAIGSPLDTARVEYEVVRHVASVITAIFGALGRSTGVVALHNAGTGTLFEPSHAGGFVACLGDGELPVPLWTYTLAHDLSDGNICLSTSGLYPFLGHELEVWNAPISREEASDRVSQTIIYLLQRGAVIDHGHTIGKTRGDKSIRCFRGASRAGRAKPVEALFLEFAGDDGDVAPRPDADPYAPVPGGDAIIARLSDRDAAPPPPPSAPSPSAQPGWPAVPRRPGGFGRKGL